MLRKPPRPFHPPANRESYKDLLIFEERLKQNAERQATPHSITVLLSLTPHLNDTDYRNNGGNIKVRSSSSSPLLSSPLLLLPFNLTIDLSEQASYYP